jgi:hypothetical protein
MAVVETVFFNYIEGSISGAFPVLRQLNNLARWQRLVRSFIAEHQAHTAYFLRISQEFLAWLQQGYTAEPGDPPFILELAHYEWVELALDVSEANLPAQGWSSLCSWRFLRCICLFEPSAVRRRKSERAASKPSDLSGS